MTTERRVSLFRNGRNQASASRATLLGTEVILTRHGDRLIITPARPTSLLALLATLDPIEDELPEIEDPAPRPIP